MYKNKKIFILGMARSGYEVAKLLSKYNNQILITDAKDQDLDHVKELESLGVKFIKSDDPIELINETYDVVVKNPGITYNHPLIKKAIELGIEVVNEIEVGYTFLPKGVKIIAVTGANGKTTTTTLCYEFVKAMGKRVHLGGNIGYPLSGLVDKVEDGDIVVLEISAQQLHDCYKFNPDIAILTNLIPVHIDFFGDYENYKNHKKRIFQNHTRGNIAIINKSNEDSLKLTDDIKSKKIYFSSNVNADLCIKDNAIYYFDEKVIDLDDIRIKGNHNYENIMCAIAATKELGITNSEIKEVLNKFAGVEHRLEFVDKINGIDFYNDSKATNVKSTEIALGAFSSPVILIAGGLDRGHSFEDLTDDLEHVKYACVYGETKNRLKEFFDKNNIKCEVFDNLKESVRCAYSKAVEGDTILLSPACASWDQYDNFELRGKDFKESIEELKNE